MHRVKFRVLVRHVDLIPEPRSRKLFLRLTSRTQVQRLIIVGWIFEREHFVAIVIWQPADTIFQNHSHAADLHTQTAECLQVIVVVARLGKDSQLC